MGALFVEEETGLESHETSLERRVGGVARKQESGSFGGDDDGMAKVGVGRRVMEGGMDMKVMTGLISGG